MNEGFKSLGFILKPNTNGFEYWLWLYKKIEYWVSLWVNMWFSRGGRLILLKSISQSILVYLTFIAKIPKGILLKIHKKGFQLLW